MKNFSFSLVFVTLLLVFLSGCAGKSDQELNKSKAAEIAKQPSAPVQGFFGSTCSSAEQCANYCTTNVQKCILFCQQNPKQPECSLLLGYNPPIYNQPAYNQQYYPNPTYNPSIYNQHTYNQQQNQQAYAQQPSQSAKCTDTQKIKFGASPIRIEDLLYIEPMGSVHAEGGHITPIDHQYHYPIKWKDASVSYDVLAPAAGNITSIGRLNFDTGDGKKAEDYRFVIEHSCSISTIYIHISKPSAKIIEIIGDIPAGSTKNPRIPVDEGEVIGKKILNGLDFNVVDKGVTLSGFIVPDHYIGEPWKIHTVDPFDYFKEPLRTQLLAKNLRSVEPFGGKIDHDIDGYLVGNWFKENTNGYNGNNPQRYWSTHLAFTYDNIDPNHIILSLGDFNGASAAFGVKGNSPDIASVSTGSGITKYELVRYEYIDNEGKRWEGEKYVKGLKRRNQEDTEGTVLVQLIEKRKIKFELFPKKSKNDVSGFTNNAIIYER